MNGVVLEGTWDEISAHADDLRQYPRLTLIIPDSTDSKPAAPKPNQGMLDALARIAERQQNRPHSSARDTDRLIREARAGGMYGRDPGD